MTNNKFRILFVISVGVILVLLSTVGVVSATETVLIDDNFDGTSLNPAIWGNCSFGNQGPVTVGGGVLSINSGTQSGGGSGVCSINLYTPLLFSGDADMLVLDVIAKVSTADGGEWGFSGLGHAGRIGFIINPSGNDLEASFAPLDSGSFPGGSVGFTGNLTVFNTYRIELEQDVARFYVNDLTNPIATFFENVATSNHMQINLNRISFGVAETLTVDYLKLTAVKFPTTINVDIDIKPGSDPNCINQNGQGVIPVAILTTATFDASTVDPFSVTLEGAGVRVKGKSGNAGSLEDVDGDGDLDLVVQIEDNDNLFDEGQTTATLNGNLFDGTLIEGTDSICIVP